MADGLGAHPHWRNARSHHSSHRIQTLEAVSARHADLGNPQELCSLRVFYCSNVMLWVPMQRVPHSSRHCCCGAKGGFRRVTIMMSSHVPKGLQRYYGGGEFHFITCSCHGRQPLLRSADRRDLFLDILEQTRKKYHFIVAGYVVMPEHFHLLISDRNRTPPRLPCRF